MNRKQVCYRELKKYKYQVVDQGYQYQTDLDPRRDIVTDYINLDASGLLTVKVHYAWDGPSGPTIDTRTFMRGSLVHDALYQLMQLRELDHDRLDEHRKKADDLLRDICREDGMNRFRAWYVHKAVRLAGEKHARKPITRYDDRICVP